MLLQFFRGFIEIPAGQSPLEFVRLCNGLCFRGRILARVVIEQRRHGCGIRSHFLDRLREPFVDGAVHQPIREPEHGNYRQKRQQQADHHQARAELGTGHALPPFRVELQQVASENDRQRHEGEENQAAQSGKKQDLLIAVGADELQIERGLQHQDREQQEKRRSRAQSPPSGGRRSWFRRELDSARTRIDHIIGPEGRESLVVRGNEPGVPAWLNGRGAGLFTNAAPAPAGFSIPASMPSQNKNGTNRCVRFV